MLELIKELAFLKDQAQDFVLATIIQHGGSTPRSSGAKMLVRPDGTISGTIGGGKLEAEVIELALAALKDGRSRVVDFHFTGEDAASMDMICGGSARVLLDHITPHNSGFWQVVEAVASSGRHGRGWLVMEIAPDGTVTHRHVGAAQGLQNGVENVRHPELQEETGSLRYIEPLLPSSCLYIFGAGHVSRPVAQIAQLVGFHTVVIDDRPEFANRERFPLADEILVASPITEVFDRREFGQTDCIVIVTRGHLQDQLVLEPALGTQAGYVGMIGSKRKCRMIFDNLKAKGWTDEQIGRVHAPIGLNIQAETPEEIAVSIVAELIQERAKLLA